MARKILCLHGYSLNGEALDRLLGEFKRSVGDSYEYVCPDGEIDCIPAKEIAKIYSPPHRCFHGAFPDENEVRESHRFLYDILDDEGPFEGVLGFSQGAGVAASLLFEQTMQPGSERPEPLFKFAVFIGGTQPWDIYEPTSKYSKELQPLKPVCAAKYAARIDIPTAHIMGRKDIYRDGAKSLLALCNPQKAKVYDHQGSHMFPRGQTAMEDLTAAFDWVTDRATFQ
ncbi:hypothetical protein JMJ35_006427 [Cladonia borealis]|uniref:Serine hydrolase domain-containing protein n=1 Tax=Cladonia borealis TaxID=184061 RepID=A0AA39QZB6_9LECA|nr:hypothetical protein JMJ35_006427 [Cladonia borealis]